MSSGLVVAGTASFLLIALSGLAANQDDPGTGTLQPDEAATMQCAAPPPLTGQRLAQRKRFLDTAVLEAKAVHALVGVDALGRAALAMDVDRNGVADMLVLYTEPQRLQGPWSKYLTRASVKINEGSILITDEIERFALAISVPNATEPSLPKWANEVFARRSTAELVRMTEGGPLMSSLDHGNIKSWPANFHLDLLDPNTGGGCGPTGHCCEDTECDAGGAGAMGGGCSIGGCTGVPATCSIPSCIDAPHLSFLAVIATEERAKRPVAVANSAHAAIVNKAHQAQEALPRATSYQCSVPRVQRVVQRSLAK